MKQFWFSILQHSSKTRKLQLKSEQLVILGRWRRRHQLVSRFHLLGGTNSEQWKCEGWPWIPRWEDMGRPNTEQKLDMVRCLSGHLYFRLFRLENPPRCAVDYTFYILHPIQESCPLNKVVISQSQRSKVLTIYVIISNMRMFESEIRAMAFSKRPWTSWWSPTRPEPLSCSPHPQLKFQK